MLKHTIEFDLQVCNLKFRFSKTNTEKRCKTEQRAGLVRRTKQQNKPSGGISVHQPSLGICEAVLVSVTHSNAEYHDNRLTDDWSGCRTLVSDLTTV